MKSTLLLVVLLMLACRDVSGEMFTALVDLEQLLHAEREVALHLRQFVDEQAQRLRLLTLYVIRSTSHSAFTKSFGNISVSKFWVSGSIGSVSVSVCVTESGGKFQGARRSI